MPDKNSAKFRDFGRESFAAISLAFFSIPALAFSIFLTLLKFRTNYRCDGFMQNVCSSGCDIALSDAWSMLFGLPISAYGTAYYVIILMTALAMGLLPAAFVVAVRLPVLILGIVGFAISALLGTYAWFGLGIVCPYCSLLYIANLGIFLSTRLLNPEGTFWGFLNGLRRLNLQTMAIVWAILSGLLALVVVQQRAYNQYASRAVRDRMQHTLLSCAEEDLRRLPETAFKLRSKGPPEIIVALFIDLACPHCRKEIEFWSDYQRKNSEFLQVEFFHFSADPACGPLNSASLQSNQSCNGALALECLNELRGGPVRDTLTKVLSLQDRGSPYFSVEHIEELSNELNVRGVIDCMNQSDAIRRIRQHIHFGISKKLNAPPSALIIPTHRGVPYGLALRLRGGGKPEAYIDAKVQELLSRSKKQNAK